MTQNDLSNLMEMLRRVVLNVSTRVNLRYSLTVNEWEVYLLRTFSTKQVTYSTLILLEILFLILSTWLVRNDS